MHVIEILEQNLCFDFQMAKSYLILGKRTDKNGGVQQTFVEMGVKIRI